MILLGDDVLQVWEIRLAEFANKRRIHYFMEREGTKDQISGNYRLTSEESNQVSSAPKSIDAGVVQPHKLGKSAFSELNDKSDDTLATDSKSEIITNHEAIKPMDKNTLIKKYPSFYYDESENYNKIMMSTLEKNRIRSLLIDRKRINMKSCEYE
ncbi:hypothetical protein O9G_005367 [Rozella allomycis CSF55]|uniref:Uncharacterized protein n=1 Tax=Rozella allomycis (strain CSF55) TaxID=988480 RepID=A0A075AYH8_ROZAC|nr:hypothetical protein O9G_005367 [Rozella allomycis CSF55]|eukprot:EPZ35164.1 hypothetical protein O9G_005367 [Rozella allomycis CSF55]